MDLERTERWVRLSATSGAAVWVVLTGLAGAGKAALGVIELLFLFAPLVIVPLGLALGRRVAPLRHQGVEIGLQTLQPLAAGLVVASLWVPPGRIAGALAAPWLILCVVLGIEAFLTLLRPKNRGLVSWAVNIGRMDLVVAAAWLVASRLGMRPLGIQEPIGLLTAVHFHYTGFATALLAGTLVAHVQERGHGRKMPRLLATLVIVPFVVATGFVWSPTLKLVAVLALAVGVIGLAGWQFWVACDLHSAAARGFLRLSSLAVLAGMVLAGVYAIGDWLKQDWLVIPRMASTHGLLNGLGFVLLGLLGWLVSAEPSN
jgi:hypothetical protein